MVGIAEDVAIDGAAGVCAMVTVPSGAIVVCAAGAGVARGPTPPPVDMLCSSGLMGAFPCGVKLPKPCRNICSYAKKPLPALSLPTGVVSFNF